MRNNSPPTSLPKIGITISVFNEENDLQKVISEIRGVLKDMPYKYFIHIQDDGSCDTSVLIGKKYADFVSVHTTNKGLAKTFQDGIQKCIKNGADIVVHIDGDGQYVLSVLPIMITEIEKGADMVIGSRFLQGNRYIGKRSRNIGNIFFSFFISLLCRNKLSDVTSGFRVFDKKIIEIPITSKFTYTYEQVIRASKLKYRIVDIGITTRASRKSHLMKSSFQYIRTALQDICRILLIEPVTRYFRIHMEKNIGGNYFDKHNSKNPLVRILMKNFYKTFLKCLEKEYFSTLVDIGCGEGHLSFIIQEHFAKYNTSFIITALEYDEPTIIIGNALYPSLHIKRGNILTLDGKYDILISSEVLEHIEDFETAINTCKKVAPVCVFSTPNEPWFRIANLLRLKYICRLGNTPGHVNNWSRNEFEILLKKHFVSVSIERTGIWNIAICKNPKE